MMSARRRAGSEGSPATSTVGRSKPVVLRSEPSVRSYADGLVSLTYGDALDCYPRWPAPTVIISDGAYGVLGFDGDTSDHLGIPAWYDAHVAAWTRAATPRTTLWFWNSEIGWAAAHPVLEKHGWRYVSCNVWNKGRAHMAGNVDTGRIRRFPVVSELCVQYVLEARIEGKPLKAWLRSEWMRTGLPLGRANEACGVKDAAVRKYLDQGHLWYFPPVEAMRRLVEYANAHGRAEGRPFFSLDGKRPITPQEWLRQRSNFRCPFGVTNVWDRGAIHGSERVRIPGGKAVHLNQKPLDLMTRIIAAASDEEDVVWEPFGGLFSAAIAARRLRRRAFAAELDRTYFQYGVDRVRRATSTCSAAETDVARGRAAARVTAER